MLTARQAAEAMLEGATMLPEARGTYVVWGSLPVTPQVPQGACAIGAAAYALGGTEYSYYITPVERVLTGIYCRRFGTDIPGDNDRYGRDHVLRNVKELINEGLLDEVAC